jgi:hypothetical protein
LFEADVGLCEKLTRELPVQELQSPTDGVDLAKAGEVAAERSEVDLHRPSVRIPFGLDQRLLERLIAGD